MSDTTTRHSRPRSDWTRADHIAEYASDPRGYNSDPRTWPEPEPDQRSPEERAAAAEAHDIAMARVRRDVGQFWSRATVDPQGRTWPCTGKFGVTD